MTPVRVLECRRLVVTIWQNQTQTRSESDGSRRDPVRHRLRAHRLRSGLAIERAAIAATLDIPQTRRHRAAALSTRPTLEPKAAS